MSDLKNEKKKRSNGNKIPTPYFFILLAIYIATSVLIARSARSEDVIRIFNNAVPISAFAGVISSIGNICLILMTVFFRKPGFYTSLILLISQYPIMIMQIMTGRNRASIPGMFTSLATILAIVLLYRRNNKLEDYQSHELEYFKGQQKASQRLFEQTATALVNAIDAKDTYSHGHSMRVAEYSEKIARMMGKDDEECREIYYTALLHDVGKIGIPNSIINKKGKLTEEEYEVIKQHPVFGNQILSSISEYPYLSIGAHYHHERYDGKGYPDHLKGGDIPEIARIISVADAYDAMTSTRSYRAVIPQDLVREEIVKCAGTQFDPNIARIMQYLIDMDADYKMRERVTAGELGGKSVIHCEEYRSEVLKGIVLTQNQKKIRLTVEKGENCPEIGRGAAIILFDALDGRVHSDEKMIATLCYYEYCEMWLGSQPENKGVRKIQTVVREHEPGAQDDENNTISYEITAVKCKDHVLLTVDDGARTMETTIALPDSTRYAYIGITGEYCDIRDISIEQSETPIDETYIPRIAEEVSFLDGPEGDIPNLQVNGYRTEASQGIPLHQRLTIRYHSKSLPTARLVWHCPYFVIYSSDDGVIHGPNYREFSLIRLDGEDWEAENAAENKLFINKHDSFEGWDVWRATHKKGIDSSITFIREGDMITATTENLGISLESITKILDGTQNVYVAITGDQCTITNIRIDEA